MTVRSLHPSLRRAPEGNILQRLLAPIDLLAEAIFSILIVLLFTLGYGISLHAKETKNGLVLSGSNQDALQALFGDDVTGCFGKRVLLEPAPMRVSWPGARRDPLKAALSSNGTGPKVATSEATEEVRQDPKASG